MTLENNRILGACLEDCIHVAGILNFFQFIESFKFETEFLGPAVPINTIIESIKKSNAKIIGISYRLTPVVGIQLIKKLIKEIKLNKLEDRTYYLGCLTELAELSKDLNFFSRIFRGGESIGEMKQFLQLNLKEKDVCKNFPNDLISRVEYIHPYPILRAHFGLPSLEDTIQGIEKIAKAKILDVISIAPDQAAQEWLHHPEILKTRPKGTGGVEIRTKLDLERLYTASRFGNYPLLRIYSGTQDLVKNAELFQETIKNAWTAIPIFFYSKLDGRSQLDLECAITEHFDAIKWHVERNIPVEINDPHQWGLRMAPDHLVVADAYICARIAKELGVETYIEQLMFNTPIGVSLKMDLARVLAMIEIVQPLISDKFRILKETRTGLSYLSPNLTEAKSQLIISSMVQMAIKPNIVHVVSYTEADHSANPDEIIESCTMVKKVIQDSYLGLPDLTLDPLIQQRKEELINESKVFINAFENYFQNQGIDNPYISPSALNNAVSIGLFDAPQLKGSTIAKGQIMTRIIDGKCVLINDDGRIIKEIERLNQINDLKDIFVENSENRSKKIEVT
jgi:hypothetical protein